MADYSLIVQTGFEAMVLQETYQILQKIILLQFFLLGFANFSFAQTIKIDETEVTVNQYKECVNSGACSATNLTVSEWGPSEHCNWGKFFKGSHPINCVNYFQAKQFCNWQGKKLPSNKEWSSLFSQNNTKKFPWGDEAPKRQLCWDKSDVGGTCEVASYKNGSSETGHHDLAGNVWEWTSTKACSTCRQVVTKGGAWSGNWSVSVIEKFGADFDGLDYPETRGSYLGFRCATGEAQQDDNLVAANKPQVELPIDFYVVLDEGGTGNHHWNSQWINQVLEKSSSLLHGEVKFKVGKLEYVENSAVYGSKRQGVMLKEIIEKNAQFGRVTVGISHPNTIDSAGLAAQESFNREFRSRFVIRSRKNSGSAEDLYETAAIFLHELSHTLGFSHGGTTFQKPYITDGWWDIPDARKHLITLTEWVGNRDRFTANNAIDKFSCKVGSPVPDTNVMYDPPTDAEDINECASRCLSDNQCVAIAQPTFKNARCYLYSEGAQVIKRQGWSNVNTCWKK